MNQLKVNQQQSIIILYEQGWSKRRIARQLGLDRATVRKYLVGAGAKPATNPHTGSAVELTSKSPGNPHTGSLVGLAAKSPTNPHIGSVPRPGPASACEPWRAQIEQWVERGLSVQRIYQDLVLEHQFAGSYHAVRRFVARLIGTQELPFRRMECAPGQELQVDFGQGAWVIEEGKRRRPHLFRAVLSHSRKGYSEAVWRQTSESEHARERPRSERLGGFAAQGHFLQVAQNILGAYVARRIANDRFGGRSALRPALLHSRGGRPEHLFAQRPLRVRRRFYQGFGLHGFFDAPGVTMAHRRRHGRRPHF